MRVVCGQVDKAHTHTHTYTQRLKSTTMTDPRTHLPLELVVLELHRGHELVLDAVLQLEDGELAAGGGHLFCGVLGIDDAWLAGRSGSVCFHTYVLNHPTQYTQLNPHTNLLEGLQIPLRVGLHDGDLELGRLDLLVGQPVVHLLGLFCVVCVWVCVCKLIGRSVCV